MSRFATLTGALAALLLPLPALAANEPAVPDGLQVALIRPALPITDAPVEPAVFHPTPSATGAPLRPSLAARYRLAPKLIVKVDLSKQIMHVIVDGQEKFTWKVSTARAGYRTPTGEWTPYRMHVMWHSRKYDNAPMPHSIFFTGGYAIHATPYVKRLGTPASHGCVRLHPTHAAELFSLAKQYGPRNMRVVIRR